MAYVGGSPDMSIVSNVWHFQKDHMLPASNVTFSGLHAVIDGDIFIAVSCCLHAPLHNINRLVSLFCCFQGQTWDGKRNWVHSERCQRQNFVPASRNCWWTTHYHSELSSKISYLMFDTLHYQSLCLISVKFAFVVWSQICMFLLMKTGLFGICNFVIGSWYLYLDSV